MPPNDCQSDQTLTLHTSLANLPTVTSHLGGHTGGLTRTPVQCPHCPIAVLQSLFLRDREQGQVPIRRGGRPLSLLIFC